MKRETLATLLSSVLIVPATLFSAGSSFSATYGQGVTNPQPLGQTDSQPGYVAYRLQNGQPIPVGKPVDISLSDGIKGNDIPLYWSHNGIDDQVHWIVTNALINGNPVGKILQYDLSTTNVNNGYLLISKQDYPDWVQAVGGVQKYVDTELAKKPNGDQSILADDFNQWTVVPLSDVLNLSGATIDQGYLTSTGGVNMTDQEGVAEGNFNIHPSSPPTSSVTTDQTAYAPGDTVNINLTNTTFAPWTSHHLEALEVTGPNGFDKFLPINDNGNTVQAATGTNFPFTPSDTAVTSLASNAQVQPGSSVTTNESATLDTTGLPAGTYTVKYTMYDEIARPSSSGINGTVISTFTIDPTVKPKTPGGTSTGGGGGGSTGGGGTGGSGGSGGGTGGSGGGTGSGGGGTIIQNPGTSDGDISVKFANYLWNHWPKNGETGHVDMVLTNTNDYDGAGIEYDLKAWSDDNSLFQPIDIEKAVVNVPAGQSVTIPLTYKVQREFKDYKWQGYHIHYTVTIRPHVIPGSPDDPPPPPLNDSDLTNDTAKLDQYIIGPPRLVK
ncbi:hypothetical protein DNHGIG_32120 [Collibacillus ludicampi]|uniref:Uncharacterized protein n=1 Tax=Collibacillus ludicampi TaxID=2771369 RepID=A0AAV4LIR4_9BACL|nr:hypothetical protein [Collibacillus ludicampi]GIM47663.1 hypothetical protein DNHGIG_32120 [Collibacillus ludicampi]